MVEPVREETLANLPGTIHPYITEAAVRKAIESADPPPRQAPVLGLVPLEDGGLIVLHDFDPQTGRSGGDLFDKGGRFLGSCGLPPAEINIYGGYLGSTAKMWFRNGRLFTIKDEDGEYVLCRYAYELTSAP